MRIPLNRVVAFVGPYITIVSSAAAAWLVARVNVLGIPGLDKSNVATWIAAGLTALLTAAVHALGGWAWLKGHHIQLANTSPPTADDEGPGDPDALPNIAAADPSQVPPDQGDAGAPTAPTAPQPAAPATPAAAPATPPPGPPAA